MKVPPMCVECARPVRGKCRRGRCSGCYQRRRKELAAAGVALSGFDPVKVLMAKVEKTTEGCWLYTGYLDRDGYVQLRRGGRPIRGHRFAYELFVGPIPEGMQIDHVCHNRDATCNDGVFCRHRRCLNPAHLEPVTNTQNTYRSKSVTGINSRKTHCIHGHAFVGDNIIWRSPRSPGGRPRRNCKACNVEAKRRYKAARRSPAA